MLGVEGLASGLSECKSEDILRLLTEENPYRTLLQELPDAVLAHTPYTSMLTNNSNSVVATELASKGVKLNIATNPISAQPNQIYLPGFKNVITAPDPSVELTPIEVEPGKIEFMVSNSPAWNLSPYQGPAAHTPEESLPDFDNLFEDPNFAPDDPFAEFEDPLEDIDPSSRTSPDRPMTENEKDLSKFFNELQDLRANAPSTPSDNVSTPEESLPDFDNLFEDPAFAPDPDDEANLGPFESYALGTTSPGSAPSSSPSLSNPFEGWSNPFSVTEAQQAAADRFAAAVNAQQAADPTAAARNAASVAGVGLGRAMPEAPAPVAPLGTNSLNTNPVAPIAAPSYSPEWGGPPSATESSQYNESLTNAMAAAMSEFFNETAGGNSLGSSPTTASDFDALGRDDSSASVDTFGGSAAGLGGGEAAGTSAADDGVDGYSYSPGTSEPAADLGGVAAGPGPGSSLPGHTATGVAMSAPFAGMDPVTGNVIQPDNEKSPDSGSDGGDGGGWVVCTHLAHKGLLDEDLYRLS